ncbi:hypothetical protein CTI12_AA195860 [Artemisia annua]|uniref:Retrotransposon gag domain-containing protein n=1 Tax=Artemisia annua TaxID=35608 RepID=A0A2U1P4L2_ARTAN|nr:hypothetical protein CTI12_AA195860 [Artemisia annua]
MLRNDILAFQQRQGETLCEAWTRFKDLLKKVPHHGIDLWLQVQIFYDHINLPTRQTIDQAAGGKLRDLSAEQSWDLLEDLALYDNESWNDPRDLNKTVKAISLPSNNSSTSDRRIIELEDQVKFLMKSYEAPKPSSQVNKITSSCELCSGPHDTRDCMELPEQAFADYASSRTDGAGDKWYTFKPEPNPYGDSYNPSWKNHPNLRWKPNQNAPQNNSSNPPNRFQPNGSNSNRTFNNNPSNNYGSTNNFEGLMSNFMASQEARIAKFTSEFNQQQLEMTNKIDNLLKALNNQVLSPPHKDARNTNSGPQVKDPSSSKQVHFVNVVTIKPIPKNEIDSEHKEEVKTNEDEVKEVEVDKEAKISGVEEVDDEEDYFNRLPTKEERAYHKDLFDDPETPYFLGNPIIKTGDPSNINIPCNIGHLHVWKAYIDLKSPINIMTRAHYNLIMKKQLGLRTFPSTGWISNFVGRVRGLHVYIGNFTYITDFVIVEDIRPVVDACLTQVVFGKPFVEASKMNYDPSLGIVRFKDETDDVAYQMPCKIEQYRLLSNIEKEHKQAVYYRNDKDRSRGVDYVMSRIFGFYKECLQLGLEYKTKPEDDLENVTIDGVTVVVDNVFELVDYWVTFNEPHVLCMLTYCAGAWPGSHPDMLETATSALPTGIFLSVVLLKPIVGVAHHVSFMRPYGLFDVAAVSLANSMSLFPFLDDIAEKMDFIGINYYGQGVRVLGYLFWTTSDNWEWADGYGPKFGIVAVDRFNDLARVVTSGKITRQDRGKAWYELQKAAREKKTRPFYRAINKNGLMYSGVP